MSDHAVHTFYPVTLGEAFLPILIICLIAWPAHLSLINVLNIYCILCFNIVWDHSLHTKPCKRTTLNGLITESAPVYPSHKRQKSFTQLIQLSLVIPQLEVLP